LEIINIKNRNMVQVLVEGRSLRAFYIEALTGKNSVLEDALAGEGPITSTNWLQNREKISMSRLLSLWEGNMNIFLKVLSVHSSFSVSDVFSLLRGPLKHVGMYI